MVWAIVLLVFSLKPASKIPRFPFYHNPGCGLHTDIAMVNLEKILLSNVRFDLPCLFVTDM